MGKVYECYNALVETSDFFKDSAQIAVIARYDALLQTLSEKQRVRKRSTFWISGKCKQKGCLVKGLYVHGGVGGGKTMLMDLFYSCLPDGNKRRIHFNDFMSDVHDRIKVHRQVLEQSIKKGNHELFFNLAATLAEEAHVLCCDEFTVTDIADAMILARLFTALFRQGIVFVATSNIAPDELYHHGLNRQLFLPFITILKGHVNIANLNALTDYRLEKAANNQAVYMTPLNKMADDRMNAAWTEITSSSEEKTVEITARGRVVKVPRSSGSVTRFNFTDLCSKPLSAFDYMTLVARYQTFFIDHVPVLDDTRLSETKRFILLIDTLYDHHIRLFMSADSEPNQLYRGYIKTIETFEFKRTVSRLFEMQSSIYLMHWMSINQQKK